MAEDFETKGTKKKAQSEHRATLINAKKRVWMYRSI